MEVGLRGDTDGDVPAVEQEASHAGGVVNCIPESGSGVDMAAGPQEGEVVAGHGGAGRWGPEGTEVEAATAAAAEPGEGLGFGYPEDADHAAVHHLKLAKLMGWR